METEEQRGDPQWNYWLEIYPPRATVTLFSHYRSLSISHLSDLHQRAATVSLGERGRGEEKGELLILNAIFSCLTVKLYSSHTPVVCRALLCSRKLKTEPSCSSGSSQVCLTLRGKHSFLSQPSSLTAFPSHTRVIKKATCPPPSPLIFSFHHSISLFGWSSSVNAWHLYSTRTKVNYWEAEKWGYISFLKLPLNDLFQAFWCYHGSQWLDAFLFPISLNE